MSRITLTIGQDERQALALLAERERRDPRDQATLIIVRELQRVGLLKTEPEQRREDLGKANRAGATVAA